MTLQTSGAISMSQIAAELGLSLPLSLTDSRVVGLAGKGSPPINFSDLYGKSNIRPITVTVNPTNVFVTKTATGSGYVNSGTVTATASNGNGSYTYFWTQLSQSGAVINIGNPNVAATGFSCFTTNGSINISAFRCTVTDGVNTAGSVDISIELDGYPF